jgi:hypothetical protein
MKCLALTCVTVGIAVTWGVVGAACNGNGGMYGAAPELTLATPASGGVNTTVTLSGQHLCGIGDNCQNAGVQLYFLTPQMIEIQYANNTPTTITFVMPSFVPVGQQSIVVEVGGEPSNDLAFSVTPR